MRTKHRHGDNPEDFQNLPIDRQIDLLNWISDNLRPIKSINRNYNSYGLKHHVKLEPGKNPYYTNGEFKGAMLEKGFVAGNENSLNWSFNVSEKSVKEIKRKNRFL